MGENICSIVVRNKGSAPRIYKECSKGGKGNTPLRKWTKDMIRTGSEKEICVTSIYRLTRNHKNITSKYYKCHCLVHQLCQKNKWSGGYIFLASGEKQGLCCHADREPIWETMWYHLSEWRHAHCLLQQPCPHRLLQDTYRCTGREGTRMFTQHCLSIQEWWNKWKYQSIFKGSWKNRVKSFFCSKKFWNHIYEGSSVSSLKICLMKTMHGFQMSFASK